MTAQTTVTVKDYGRDIFKRLQRLNALSMQFVIKGTYPKTGIPVATIAAIHEFGSERIPSRPFWRQARYRLAEVRGLFTTEVEDIINSNRTAETAARNVAKRMARTLVDAIDHSPEWATQLSEITVRIKGHDHPLIHSGLLRASIYWRVSEGERVLEEGPGAR